jgi:hypothetical protein
MQIWRFAQGLCVFGFAGGYDAFRYQRWPVDQLSGQNGVQQLRLFRFKQDKAAKNVEKVN